MQMHTRQQWGAQYREGFGTRSTGRLNKWLHHSVTTDLDEHASFEQEAAQMRNLERIGQSRFGGGISYSIAVFRSGRIYIGLGIDRIGAHTAGHNSTSVGIVLVGNYQNSPPTPQQEAAIAWLLNHGVQQGWWRENALSGGHRDTKSTSCPGDAAYVRIPAINAKADGGSGGYTPPAAPAQPAPAPAPAGRLKLDGNRGPATTRRWQAVMGTPQDGVITPYPVGSSLIRADQSFLNSVVGKTHVRNLTGRSKLDVDGFEGPNTIKVRQFWLYNQYAKKVLGRAARASDFDGRMGPETTKLLQYALNHARTGSKRY